jgi:hypothetical protein
MNLKNITATQNLNRPLKRSKTGLEVEMHLIDSNGKISNNAPDIISAVSEFDPKIPIVKECGKNMVEFGCYPAVDVINPALDLIKSLEATIEIADKQGISLFPFATYPGKFIPETSQGEGYCLKKSIFGEERFMHAQRCTGFHHHYTLPKGVFNNEKKEIRLMVRSKLSRSLIGSYNFEIAVDPILTLFAQSSPFYQGVNFAKDARVVMYRGGKKLKNTDGVYANLQQIGGLPPYKQNATDLIHSMNRRIQRWKRVIKKADPSANFDKLYPFKLDIGWHPVKINKHGTLEERGMDMNYPSILFAISTLLKYSLKKIQHEFIEVIPTDLGIHEPFKIEDGILHIPPHTYVRNKYQVWSAVEGYNNKKMYEYVKRFYNFAKALVPKSKRTMLDHLDWIIEHKESTSDRIIRHCRRKSIYNDGSISDSDACELALYYASKFPKNIDQVKQKLLKLSLL